MANTTFRCGHCGNLMAVDNQYLGQQVACPTCKQVVVAPAPQPVPTPTPEPTPTPTPVQPPTSFPSLSLGEEHESIFSTPSSDDLFDDPAPVLRPAVEQPALQPVQPTTEVDGGLTLDEAPTQPTPVLSDVDLIEQPSDQTPTTPTWPTPAQEELPAQESAPAADLPARPRKGRDSSANWLLLFMIPLVSYAVLATVLIVYLIFWALPAASTSVRNPIENMPDIHGDYPGAKKPDKKTETSWNRSEDLERGRVPLPPSRKTRLGQTITVGNLEVTPTKVERKKVSVFVKGYANPEPCLFDSLVLHLKLKNLSDEYAFVPLEDCFDRFWSNSRVPTVPPLDGMPLTALQVGETTFHGGPASWLPKVPPKRLENRHREWVQGRPKPGEVKYLQPGETEETFTCTDGQNEKIVPAALASTGDLVWRVHLRQGPVAIKGRDALVPSTTIVGVLFTAADVKRN